jgi:hypothetical protein
VLFLIVVQKIDGPMLPVGLRKEVDYGVRGRLESIIQHKET